MITIIHHSADFDGHASGHSVRHILGKKTDEVNMIGWDYKDEITFLDDLIEKNDKFDKIYITDISFPPAYMIRLKEIGAVWIDHHITAIKDSEANGYADMAGLREDGTAACRLVWQFFAEKPPESILLLGLYDVFDKSTRDWESDTVPFQYGLRGIANPSWTYILEYSTEDIENVKVLGRGIIQYQRLMNEEEANKCFDLTIDGFKLIAKNANSGSAHFDWMTEEETKGYDGMMRFQYAPDKNIFSCSCYGWEHSPDLSGIAKKYGGGGHARACGFTTTLKELTGLLK